MTTKSHIKAIKSAIAHHVYLHDVALRDNRLEVAQSQRDQIRVLMTALQDAEKLAIARDAALREAEAKVRLTEQSTTNPFRKAHEPSIIVIGALAVACMGFGYLLALAQALEIIYK